MCVRLPTVLQEKAWLYSEIMSFLHFSLGNYGDRWNLKFLNLIGKIEFP